ncbi:MAG TPA: NUDIX domain-containing protein [Microvirga sp.]|jgi:8-oxo-dGTP pyrophosphatase MutT (NUDIX family)|nr:NUDIX domain-containing protein [Microvirga sp.]
MPISSYLRDLRARVGSDLLVLPAVTIMIFDDADRLLMARDKETGLWMTIGGAIDPDESPADAATREAFEETGLLVELERVVGVFGGPGFRITYPNGDVVSYTVIAFRARAIGGHARPDGVEVGALRYVSDEGAAALPSAPWTKTLLRAAFDRSGGPLFSAATWRPDPA